MDGEGINNIELHVLQDYHVAYKESVKSFGSK